MALESKIFRKYKELYYVFDWKFLSTIASKCMQDCDIKLVKNSVRIFKTNPTFSIKVCEEKKFKMCK